MLKKLKNQLLFILSIFIAISGLLIYVSIHISSIKDKTNRLISDISDIQLLLQQDLHLMDNFYLYESKNPEFFISNKSKYLSQHHELYSRIRSKIRILKENHPDLFMKENGQVLDTIELKLKEFSDIFYQIVYLISKKGYDAYGLEGILKTLKSSPIQNKKETEKILAEIKTIEKEAGITENSGLKKQNALISAEIISLITNFSDQLEKYRDVSFNRMRNILFILIFISGTLLFFTSIYLANKLTIRISGLAKNIDDFVKSKFSPVHAFDFKESDDEVGILIHNLRIMREEIISLLQNFSDRVNEQTGELLVQKYIIEQKNEEIQSQLDELSVKNQLIETHLDELSKKNKYIIDSINYAKRIQEALLPSDELIKSRFPESFVLYMPKDIVSGDFYWMKTLWKKDEEYTLMMVGDCTGHGVPGAFMSMLGMAFINEIILRKMVIEPSDILDTLRDYIVGCLNQGEHAFGMDDGMDIAVCLIDYRNRKLHFSGAKRPLYIIRNGEILIIKGENKSIRKSGSPNHHFKNEIVELMPDDQIFLFTDGIIDQFGEAIDEKFNYGRFKDALLLLKDKPCSDQKQLLHNIINDWRGNRKQIDDITLIGIKPWSAKLTDKSYINQNINTVEYTMN